MRGPGRAALLLLLVGLGPARPPVAPAEAAAEGAPTPRAAPVELPATAFEAVGRRLWRNECGGRVAGLTSWNRGEDFASMGIGHFLWYPAGRRGPYQETFPALLASLEAEGVSTPAWLRAGAPCPWPTRAAFEAARDSPRMRELRDLLSRTLAGQTRFVLRRLSRALPGILREVEEPALRQRLERLFAQLAARPWGVFALADYVNFKGEGTAPRERHRGEGWGLLQVLEEMVRRGLPDLPGETSASEEDAALLDAFATAAGAVLRRRVANDPTGRDRRWLRGWLRRCDAYRRPLTFE